MNDAAHILGSTEVEHKKVFYGRLPRERQERETCITELSARMGNDAFTTAWAEGETMTMEQAVAYAKELLYKNITDITKCVLKIKR